MDFSLKALRDALRRGRRFVTYDIWRLGRPGEDISYGFIIKQIRVVILLAREMTQDTLLLRAAALTFFTALSVVPFLALMVYFLQTFDVGDDVYNAITQRVEGLVAEERPAEAAADGLADAEPGDHDAPPDGGLPENGPGEAEPDFNTAAAGPASGTGDILESANRQLIEDILAFLTRGVGQREETVGDQEMDNPIEVLVNLASESVANLENQGAGSQRAAGVVGLAFLLTTVFGLMANIERSFNHIWGVSRGRSWFRTWSDYLLIILFLPFLAAAVLGVTAALQSERVLEALGPLALAVGGLQLVIIWAVFCALYKGVPNAAVKWRYALLGAIVAGTAWSLVSLAYVKFQFGLANYGFVYSSLAQFPMLLMWVFVSWVIVLFGTELSFAYQNETTFFMERLSENASYAYRESVAVRAMIEIARRFEQGEPGLSTEEAAEQWRVPTRLLKDTLETLKSAGLVSACLTTPVTYQPAKTLGRITVGDVVTAIRESGQEPSLLRSDEYFQPLFDEVAHGNPILMGTPVDDLAEKYGLPPTPLLEGPDEEDGEE